MKIVIVSWWLVVEWGWEIDKKLIYSISSERAVSTESRTSPDLFAYPSRNKFQWSVFWWVHLTNNCTTSSTVKANQKRRKFVLSNKLCKNLSPLDYEPLRAWNLRDWMKCSRNETIAAESFSRKTVKIVSRWTCSHHFANDTIAND